MSHDFAAWEKYKGTGQLSECSARVHEPQLGFGTSPSRGGRDRPSFAFSMIGCMFWLVFCCKTLTLKKKKRELGCNRPG
jgi:hypothetical protein